MAPSARPTYPDLASRSGTATVADDRLAQIRVSEYGGMSVSGSFDSILPVTASQHLDQHRLQIPTHVYRQNHTSTMAASATVRSARPRLPQRAPASRAKGRRLVGLYARPAGSLLFTLVLKPAALQPIHIERVDHRDPLTEGPGDEIGVNAESVRCIDVRWVVR